MRRTIVRNMLRQRVNAVIGFVLCASVLSGCSRTSESSRKSVPERPVTPAAIAPVPAEMTVEQVKQMMGSDKPAMYLDVRTVAEFNQGHPPHAWNIPVFVRTDDGGMQKNADFLATVEKAIPKDTYVIVGCRSGKRSAIALNIMRGAGYGQLSNVLGGFLGQRDASGTTVHSGWKEAGYEVETGDGGDHSYAKLQAGAKP